MLRIYKYVLPDTIESCSVMMPSNAFVISVGTQKGSIVVWAIVDPDSNEVPHSFHVCNTGDEPPALQDFLGTVFIRDLVKHVFKWRNKAS